MFKHECQFSFCRPLLTWKTSPYHHLRDWLRLRRCQCHSLDLNWPTGPGIAVHRPGREACRALLVAGTQPLAPGGAS